MPLVPLARPDRARCSRSWWLPLAGGTVALLAATACGGGGAQPTATAAAPTVAVSASPQRPGLVTPAASPSPAGGAASRPAGTPTPGAGAASTPAQGGETYTVEPGDTLLGIAEKVYGDSTKWRRIYDANKDVIGPNPDALKVEMKLRIPPKE